MRRAHLLTLAAAFAVAIACTSECRMTTSNGDQSELDAVQTVVQQVFADAGYPVSATCSIYGSALVRVVSDVPPWTDDQLLSPEPYLDRVQCREDGYRFTVSRADIRNSELPVQMEYALTGCSVGPEDGGWWGEWDQMAADALVAAHEVRPISGASGDSR